jgi:hypothetical protein
LITENKAGPTEILRSKPMVIPFNNASIIKQVRY